MKRKPSLKKNKNPTAEGTERPLSNPPPPKLKGAASLRRGAAGRGEAGARLKAGAEVAEVAELAGWMAGWLVGWLDGWLVGWLDGWFVGWLPFCEGYPVGIV